MAKVRTMRMAIIGALVVFGVSFAFIAYGGSEPQVVTLPASNISGEEARFTGYVVDKGDGNVEGLFEYEKENSNDPRMSTSYQGPVSVNQAIRTDVAGLEDGADYRVRFCAHDSSGSDVCGAWVPFTAGTDRITNYGSGDLNAVLATSYADHITENSALLKGDVKSLGNGPVSLWFGYGRTDGVDGVSFIQLPGIYEVDGNGVSIEIENLAPGKQYGFALCGEDGFPGDPVWPPVCGDFKFFTTVDPSAVAPSGPQNFNGGGRLRITDPSSGKIVAASADTRIVIQLDEETQEKRYFVRRDDDTASSTFASADASRARIGRGVQTLDPVEVGENDAVVALEFESIDGCTPEVYFQVGKAGLFEYTTDAVVEQDGDTVVGYQLTNLEPGVRYSYRAVAEGCGDLVYGDVVKFVTAGGASVPPTTPTLASNDSDSSVQSPVVDDVLSSTDDDSVVVAVDEEGIDDLLTASVTDATDTGRGNTPLWLFLILLVVAFVAGRLTVARNAKRTS